MIIKLPRGKHETNAYRVLRLEGLISSPRIRNRKSAMRASSGAYWVGVDVDYYPNWSALTFKDHYQTLADLAAETFEIYKRAYPELKLWYYCRVRIVIHTPLSSSVSSEDRLEARTRTWTTVQHSDPDLTVYGDEDNPDSKEHFLMRVFEELLNIHEYYGELTSLKFPFRFRELSLSIRERKSEGEA